MNVLVLQTLMKQYRVPFFLGLHRALRDDHHLLRVVYGEAPPEEVGKGDNAELPPALGTPVQNRWLCGRRLLYQPVLSHIRWADLIIAEQANKHLINYVLMVLSRMGKKKFALWGHGTDRQGKGGGGRWWLRRTMATKSDWWFAYAPSTADYLTSLGVPKRKITVVLNSTDTGALRRELGTITEDDLARARGQLGLSDGARVGLYCGGLYPNKKLPFLLSSARAIRRDIPTFELLIMGGGPDAPWLSEAVRELPWVHYLGPRFGRDKALVFRMAEIFLNPGLIGLAVLDAFCAGLPVCTTDVPVHSPEIDYLRHGFNGVITGHEPDAYAQAVVSLLRDECAMGSLRSNAEGTVNRFSIEHMVENFRSGVVACLGE